MPTTPGSYSVSKSDAKFLRDSRLSASKILQSVIRDFRAGNIAILHKWEVTRKEPKKERDLIGNGRDS